MREITIISGKGGTGKTSITAALASLADNHIMCDLDVDASDLHLLLAPEIEKKEEFISGNEAIINKDECIACGKCRDVCEFDAIKYLEHENKFEIDKIKCEGCGVCVEFCPQKAIDFPKRTCGEWYQSSTRFAPMIHAKLYAAEENSGLLVSKLRKEARKIAEKKGLDWIICDGSPGIGCPVISSLTNTDLVVVVVEPTPSGIHDMQRVISLCGHFELKTVVLVNKFDLNLDKTKEIEDFCINNNIKVIGQLNYDDVFVKSMVKGKTVTEYSNSEISIKMENIWKRIKEYE